MKRLMVFLGTLGIFIMGCTFRPNIPESTPTPAITVVQGTDYQLECHLPVHWEDRLDEWDEWLLPPKGQRFVWVYCWMKPLVTEPDKLYRDDIQLSYAVEGTTRYTTTVTAVGNNDIYMWAPERDKVNRRRYNYGATSSTGFGDRYVFAVPVNARDFILEITTMPPIPLSVQ